MGESRGERAGEGGKEGVAGTRSDKVFEGFEARGDHARRDAALFGADRDGLISEAMAIFEEDHVAGAKTGGNETFDGGDGAAARSNESERLFEKRQGFERIMFLGEREESGIEGSIEQSFDEVGGGLLGDCERKRFERAMEWKEEVGHEVGAERGYDAEAEGGDGGVGVVGGSCGVEFFGGEKGFTKERQEALAFRSDEEAAGRALEKCGAERRVRLSGRGRRGWAGRGAEHPQRGRSGRERRPWRPRGDHRETGHGYSSDFLIATFRYICWTDDTPITIVVANRVTCIVVSDG